jgi:hypothetical protein
VGIVFIGPGANTLENVSISDNKIDDTGAGSGGTTTIYLDLNDTFSNFRVDDNHISNTDSAAITLDINVEDGDLCRNLSVCGNEIINPTGRAIDVDLVFTTSAASNGQARTFRVSGNSIVSPSDDGIRIFMDQVVSGGTGELEVGAFDVSGNTIRSPGSEGIDIVLDAIVNGFNVSGNSIGSAGAEGIFVSNAVGSAGGLDGLTIVGNSIVASTTLGIGVTTSNTTRVRNLMIASNTVEGGIDGIDFDPDSDVQASSIDGNDIYGTSGNGIDVTGAGADLGSFGITNNRIRFPGQHGIECTVDNIYGGTISNNSVYSAGLSGFNIAAADLQGVTISGNNVYSADNHGILIIASDDVRGLNISNNTVVEFSEDVGATDWVGIYFTSLANTVTQALTISGNNVRTGQDDSRGIQVWIVATVAGNLTTFAMIGNTVSIGTAATNTFSFVLTGATAPSTTIAKDFTFIGNTFRGSTDGIGDDDPGDPMVVTFATVYGNIGDDAANDWTALASGWATVRGFTSTSVDNDNINDGT